MSEKKTVINIQPTFLLRSIRPSEVVEKYNKGYFKNLTWDNLIATIKPSPSKSQSSPNALVRDHTQLTTYGHNQESPIYSYKNSSNCQQVMVTTNHESYSYFNKTGGSLLIGGECIYCSRRYETEGLGIPVRMDIGYTLVTRDNVSNYEKQLIYYSVDCKHCSFQCALARLQQNNHLTSTAKNPVYFNSEQLLRSLYRSMYPDGPRLIKADDPILLKSKGGSLSYDEYSNPLYSYIWTPGIIISPIKMPYQQISV
jgi:hypothetical protein